MSHKRVLGKVLIRKGIIRIKRGTMYPREVEWELSLQGMFSIVRRLKVDPEFETQIRLPHNM